MKTSLLEYKDELSRQKNEKLQSGLPKNMLTGYNNQIHAIENLLKAFEVKNIKHHEPISFANNLNGSTQQPITTSHALVNPNRITELKTLVTGYDLARLVRMCEELNSAFQNQNYISAIIMLRAIMDHIPPLFQLHNFTEVIAQVGNNSFKTTMRTLDEYARKIADHFLHQQIRRAEALPNSSTVNFGPPLDMLLGEIVRIHKPKI